MKLYDLFEKYASQNELKDILDLLELPNKGTKKEMLDRVFLEKPKYSTKKFLNLLSLQTLNAIKKDNNITFKRMLGSFTISKGELIDSIIDEILVNENSPSEDARTGQSTIAKNDPQNPKESKTSSLGLGSVSGFGKSIFGKGGFFGESGEKDKKEPKKELKPSVQKSKLYETIDASSTKDVVKDILQGLKLEISGNKEELITRLLNSTNDSPKDSFYLFDLRTLQYMASKNNIPARRSKEDQINELLLGLFSVPIPPKKSAPEVKSELDQKFEALDEKGSKLYDIVNTTDKGSIQSALEKVGKPVSGSKNELILRLLEALENSPQRVFESFDGPSLWEMADNNEIKRRKIKQDQIDEILSSFFGIITQKSERTISPTKTVLDNNRMESNPNSKPQIDRDDFAVLVGEIKTWSPHSRYKTEGEYRIDLYAHLNAKGYKTRMEDGDTLADILVNDKIPIEVKKSPRSSEYDRAKGQLHKHCKAFNSVIAVVCDVRTRDEFDDFKGDLLEILHKYRFEVIEK
jgi:hypothetical protein